MSSPSTSQVSQPVSSDLLEQIAHKACESTLSNATNYIHSQTETWNASIITKILESIISSTTSSSSALPQTQYKYAINSTIVQHLDDPEIPSYASNATSTHSQPIQTRSPPSTPKPVAATLDTNEDSGLIAGGSTHEPIATDGAESAIAEGGSSAPARGRRGMHSATGAYWNNETDGMWSYKFEGGDKRGMDVVISVIWVAVERH